jgi:hypothetical protein
LSVSIHGWPFEASAVWQQKAMNIKMINAGIDLIFRLVVVIIISSFI